MEQNNKTEEKKSNYKDNLRKIGLFLIKRFFLLLLILAAFFCIFVWYRYIWKSEWSDARKQQYINEQAKFSFNKADYLKLVEIMESRREKILNPPRFGGKDIFFPEGF